MLTPQSPTQLRNEADGLMAEAEKLRRQADAVRMSGAPARYVDALDLYEEYSADADKHFNMAMKLYRAAHAVEHFERERRAA